MRTDFFPVAEVNYRVDKQALKFLMMLSVLSIALKKSMPVHSCFFLIFYETGQNSTDILAHYGFLQYELKKSLIAHPVFLIMVLIF